ncbi:transposase, partial [Zunongwangia sp. F363]
MQRQYKDHLSDFKDWQEKKHARDYLIFPENMGPSLSIDETVLSQGELYTIITNRKAKGKKGALVAIIAGTKAEPIVKQLLQISSSLRHKVREITLDMAFSMKHIASKCFPKAIQVTDRFHVQKLAIEALQDLRIKHRWKAIDQENEQIQKSNAAGKKYIPEL